MRKVIIAVVVLMMFFVGSYAAVLPAASISAGILSTNTSLTLKNFAVILQQKKHDSKKHHSKKHDSKKHHSKKHHLKKGKDSK